MKNLIYFFLLAAFPIFTSSCKKETVQLSDRDKFIGTYTGTTATMLTADNLIIDYSIVPSTQTIEKGSASDEIIVGRGTDSEVNTYVTGTIFLVPGYSKHLIIGNEAMAFDIIVLGQGVLDQEKELTITSSGETKYENSIFKWTIIEKLTKDIKANP